MEKTKLAMIVLVLILVMVAAPVTVFAAQSDTIQQKSLDLTFDVPTPEELAAILGLRMVTLTPEARDIALADFDYLTDKIIQVAPTQNILYRRSGISMEDYFGVMRQEIYNMTPIPSFTILLIDERWADESEEARYLAADYLASLLLIMELELDGLGHMGVQPLFLVEMIFPFIVYAMQQEIDIEQLLEEAGITNPDEIKAIERSFDADARFNQMHYNIFNTPSVLWFYGIDPSQFDFDDIDIFSELGTMNPNNITTNIIEPGRIAYFRIDCFFNNMALDSEVLFPFYEQVQNYEHLIIDVRGNSGGWINYFPLNVMAMLVNEEISFKYPEFFIANELTAGYFENPISLSSGYLYGIFPATEFVQSQNMFYFNQEDLELLDYAIVWYGMYSPSEDSIPFGGQIWLLVDGGSASASESAASISIDTGFATVVGEPTAGITGVIYTFAALPNTGILFRIDLGYTTDWYGRSNEEFGVIPQIANMPGKDALETVLALINASSAEIYVTVPLDGIAGIIIASRAFATVAVVNDIFSDAQLDVYNQQIKLTYGDISIVFTVDSSTVSVNGESLVIPLSAQVINGEIFLPLRFIAEKLDYNVDFANNAVILTSN